MSTKDSKEHILPKTLAMGAGNHSSVEAQEGAGCPGHGDGPGAHCSPDFQFLRGLPVVGIIPCL